MNKNCENCIWFECEEHGEICPFYEEEDAKQASIPYSMPKDYIKNKLDYER